MFINFLTAHNRKDLKSWWGLLREISILLALGKVGSFSNPTRKESDWSGAPISSLQVVIKSKQVVNYNLLVLYNFSKRKALPA